jgi:zinc protease
MAWLTPLDKAPRNLAWGRKKIIEQIAFATLNRRYTDIASGANPPFAAALVGASDTPKVSGLTQLAVIGAGDITASMEAMIRVQRQAVQYGFRQDEIEKTLLEMRTQRQAAVASAGTRLTPVLAETILANVALGSPPRSPQQGLDLFNEVAPTVRLEEVNAALKAAFAGQGPTLFLATNEEVKGGETAFRAAFAKANTDPVSEPPKPEEKAWPYTNFGTPGAVASQSEDKELGLTFVKFANNVRLTVKPTDFTKDQVQVRVMFGHGELDLPKDKVSPLQMLSFAFTSGGLNKMTMQERQRAFIGKSADVSITAGEGGFVLGGNPRPQDFALQMQLLAAYFTDPAWKPTDYTASQTLMAAQLQAIDRAPGGVYSLKSQLLQHSGDQRWAPPTPEMVKSITVPDIQKAMTPLMAGDVEIAIVGDITVEEAIKQTAATFGALPARKPRAIPAGARDVKFAKGTPQPLVEHHKGRADQGMAAIAWPTTGHFADPEAVFHARVLQIVMVNRMQDELREKEGKTYGVSGDTAFNKVYPQYGMLTISSQVPADSINNFYAAIDTVVADLKAAPPTQDELDRAIRPRKEELARTFRTNAYWSTSLLGIYAEPRRLEDIRVAAKPYDKVTPASVQAAAKKWLVNDKAWKMAVTPEAKLAQ